MPDRQGHGLGSSLLTALEDRFRQAGVTETRLFTGEHSDANVRLYKRLGYLVDRHEPAPGGYQLVHLRKSLRGE